jgi:hypothetical protein
MKLRTPLGQVAVFAVGFAAIVGAATLSIWVLRQSPSSSSASSFRSVVRNVSGGKLLFSLAEALHGGPDQGFSTQGGSE